jgi:hypothetical protein
MGGRRHWWRVAVVNRGGRPESQRGRGSSGMQHGDVVDDDGREGVREKEC